MIIYNDSESRNDNESIDLNNFHDLYERNEIGSLQSLFEKKFSEFYELNGYKKHPDAPLISKEDKSVIFTGASISAVKYLMEEDRIPIPGVYIIQPCIRTQDSKDAYDDSAIPLGQTFFNMTTILAPCGRYNQVCEEALELTTKTLGIIPERIKIKVTNKDCELAEYWSANKHNVDIEFDTYPDKYYQWKYGMPGISGSGLTISIYNNATESYWDVGNIVILRDTSGKELGIEFGYGTEFFLTAALSLAEPLRLSKISEVEPYQIGLHQKYTAYLEAIIQMSAAGAVVGDRKADHLFKQYIKIINHLRKNLDLKNEDVTSTCKRYCDKFNLRTAYPQLEKSLNFMKIHESRIQRFISYVEIISHTEQRVRDPLKKITDRAQQLGLSPEETVELLKSTSFGI